MIFDEIGTKDESEQRKTVVVLSTSRLTNAESLAMLIEVPNAHCL